MSDAEQRIRERAYFIWIERGRPAGCEREHWMTAQNLISQETAATLVPEQSPAKARKAKPKSIPVKRKAKSKDAAPAGVH